MLALSLFFGWPFSSASTFIRSNRTGAGLSAARAEVSGTLVTSVLVTLAATVKSNLPALPPLYGRLNTTSRPWVRGVDAVDEEARAADPGVAFRRQVGDDVGRRQVLGQHDAVADIDAVGIDRDADAVQAGHGAEREVERLLGVERLGAEGDGGRVARLEGDRFERHAVAH